MGFFCGKNLETLKQKKPEFEVQAFSFQLSVKSGSCLIFPPSMADSCARIPTQVMLADCAALG